MTSEPGVEGLVARSLLPVRQHLQGQAVTARACGDEMERVWLDLLHQLDQAEQHLARAVQAYTEQRADERVAALEAVVFRYFDLDEDPWEDHDAACPAPEDLWRMHRDLKAARIVREQAPATGGGS